MKQFNDVTLPPKALAMNCSAVWRRHRLSACADKAQTRKSGIRAGGLPATGPRHRILFPRPIFRQFIFLSVLLAALVLGGTPSLQAQSSPTATAGPNKPSLITPPSFALVQFNNQILFRVHTFGDQPAQDRADLANLRLAETLRNLFSARATAQLPEVTVGEQQGQTVLLLDQKLLLTITQADTDAEGRPADQLAQAWADKINTAIREAQRERQPAFLRWAAERAALWLLLGLVLHGLVYFVARKTGHRPGWPILTLLWQFIGLRILILFPETRPLVLQLFTGPLRPLMLSLIIGLPTAILVRLWGIILRKLFPAIPEDLSAQDRTERAFLRRLTLARVAEVTGASLLWTIAIFILIAWYGLNLSALLASAGLIGVALSLIAQDALKDLVSGIYILIDDRFGVGDTVQIGTYEGRVEKLNLRATQIRDMSGRLITISNRSIVDVANLTARWAQVDFKVGVSYYTDLPTALALLEQTAQTLAEEWSERVLAPPELLGVDAFTDQSVTLRLSIRTPPGDQWAVARELRARVKTAFDAAGIVSLNNLYAPPPAPIRAQPAQTQPANVQPANVQPANVQPAQTQQDGHASA